MTKRLLCSLLLATLAAQLSSIAEDGFRPLFNGQNLAGWDGNPELWSVEDGCITGKTAGPEQLAYNQFLIWRGGVVKNFELRAKVKQAGNNTGIQYRSRELPEVGQWSIRGYQCDIHPAPANNAMVYEEKARGILVQNGQAAVVDPEGKRWLLSEREPVKVDVAEWHEYTVIARGNHLIHKIDGQVTIDLRDFDETKRALDGLLAFQIHRGPAMKVQIKDVMLKELPEGGVVAFDKTALPAGAVPVETAKRAPKGMVKEQPTAEPARPNPASAAAAPAAGVWKWLWNSSPTPGRGARLKKDFVLGDGVVKEAVLRVTCDNGAKVFLNGELVLTNPDWQKPTQAEVAKHLRQGRNDLLVEATNKNGAAAFIASLTLRLADGAERTIWTDASWLATAPGADDWKPAKVVAEYGAKPWGAVFARLPNPGPKVAAGAKSNETAQAAPAAGKAKGKGQARAARPTAVGEAIGANVATPVANIRAPKDFKVELLYSVPGGEQGSWVNLCEDDKGRIYASDQYGGLYRFTPPAAGQPLDPKSVQKLPVEIRAVNGMAFAFGSLYVGVNDYEGKIAGGVYRLTDSDNDDQLDKVELLRAIETKGDHGVHAIVPSPDGKSLFLISGNGAKPTERSPHSPVPAIFGEDHLLPRMPDGRGFMRTVMGPGGIIYRFSPDGKEFEAYASGFRNIFDGAFNREGELFTYDADMEYDFNTPWYRPTRICHVVSGGEFGWRNGAGKRPEWYPDNLPPVVNIGPGSPTGVTFGYGAKFPAKYQNALFALDWSWGKLYAIHLAPKGASYEATKEEFLSGSPLPLTDAIIGRKDGAMYFTIGGRRVQSGLYRVTYVGNEDTSAVTSQAKLSDAATLRHQLEAFHGRQDPKAIAAAWPHLNSNDRNIRWAARTAVEHQPFASWSDKALAETDPTKQVEALMALARCAGVCPQHRTGDTPPVDATMRGKLLAALLQFDLASLPRESQLTALRTIGIVLNRFDGCDETTRQQLIARLDPLFPAATPEQNWLLCETLAYLQSPTVAAKGVALIANAPTQEEQMEYARSLRMLKTGWTSETRTAQLEWFLKAANYKGGASFDKFIEFIRNDSLATFTDAEKTQLATLIEKKPERKSAIENLGAMFVGRAPTNWTLEELSADASQGLKNRSFDNGRRMFAAAACFTCHRFDNQGGMTGPDLTGAGGRYSPHDLLDQIINPSKEINEQFVPAVLTKNNGDQVIGVVVNLSGDGVTLNTDLSDPNQRTSVDRKDVKSIEPSTVSPMPPMLLSMLKKEEILDLLAFVLSGGDKTNAMFKP